jgi:hypothetical protein
MVERALRRGTAIALIVLCMQIPATTLANSDIDVGIDHLWNDDNDLSLEERNEVAHALLELAYLYDANFPVLRPDEAAYVQRELDNKQDNPGAIGSRVQDFINSKEYKIWIARKDLKGLISHLEQIRDAKLSSPLTYSPIELRHWAAVAYHLVSGTLNESYIALSSQGHIRSNSLLLPLMDRTLGRMVLKKMILYGKW